MKVSAINNCYAFTQQRDCTNCNNAPHPRRVSPLATTGWIAAGGIGTALFGGIFHKSKIHRIAAYIGAIAVGAHVGLALAHKHHHHKEVVA